MRVEVVDEMDGEEVALRRAMEEFEEKMEGVLE